MTRNSPDRLEPARAEQPGPGARLRITVRPLGTAEGTVPSRDARYLIATFGILGSVVSGIAGAVVTLRIAPQLAGLALAELILALTAAVLIAACSLRGRRGGETRDQKERQGRVAASGKETSTQLEPQAPDVARSL